MNWLDITLICLTGLGLVKGLFDGVIKQVVSLIAILVAIFFCGKVAMYLRGPLISLHWFTEQMLPPVSYIIAFLLIMGVFLLAGEIMHRVVGATPLSIINHLFGGILGLVIMLLLCSALINVFEMVDTRSVVIPGKTKNESRFYYWTKSLIPTIYSSFSFPGWEKNSGAQGGITLPV